MSTEIAVAEKPILFSGEMVRALLSGAKTQTRRVVKGEPSRVLWNPVVVNGYGGWTDNHCRPLPCPYGKPGDRLWVRETFTEFDRTPTIQFEVGKGAAQVIGYLPGGMGYRADEDDGGQVPVSEDGQTVWRTPKDGWRPSIFMPRSASRITLEITDVRVEPLQDISESDAQAEGVTPKFYLDAATFMHNRAVDFDKISTYRNGFRAVWNEINQERGFGWDVNPWVWCLTFTRLEQSECGR